MEISKERWNEAQTAERRFHNKPKAELIEMYRDSYRQYFEYLGIKRDLKGKKVIEVGCADIPALMFCENHWIAIIIEPMPSSVLEEISVEYSFQLVKEPAENVDIKNMDEVWLFNVLQHVIDPDKLINNMKNSAKRIRYFEPIETGISDCHPHAFTADDFERWFPCCSTIYEANPKAVNFHTHKCIYGTYTNKL